MTVTDEKFDPEAAEEQFLASIRRRVTWQAEVAERLRRDDRRPVPRRVDVPLDLASLAELVAGAGDSPWIDEWEAYLVELRPYADADGVLPESFEPLIRRVFDELLH